MSFFKLVNHKIKEYINTKITIDNEEIYCQAVLEVFSRLIETGCLDINEKDEDGETILMYLVGACF